ncbi:MAG: MmcQ/YjbR family DNA-binding protein [Sphingobacteriales bacterium]|nr:MAG: MmcQ/YjbR family DNA-binding protein [Sphingobacteriales bacterium]
MNIEDVRAFALQLGDVTETFPFGPDTLVYKVNAKIFLLMGLEAPQLSINLKCDPDKAIELREEYPDNILPGYHMNKKHWNTVLAEGLKAAFVKEMIADSYNLVLKPAKKKKNL